MNKTQPKTKRKPLNFLSKKQEKKTNLKPNENLYNLLHIKGALHTKFYQKQPATTTYLRHFCKQSTTKTKKKTLNYFKRNEQKKKIVVKHKKCFISCLEQLKSNYRVKTVNTCFVDAFIITLAMMLLLL